MRVLKNDVELIAVDLQQYSSNNDILTFEFEKPLDFKTEGSLVQIIYETDKLDNIKNNNITIEEIENKIVINWRIKESITLTAGDKRTQIVIKNNDSVYLSKVFIIKILESLNVDNKIVETNLSYLEYWEERIKELAERIEQFEGTDLSQYITETLLNERLENYFNKLEIQEKLDKKADKEALASKLDAEIYNQDKSNFALNTESDKKANVNDIYTKNYTYNKTEIDNLIGNIDISEQLDNLATKIELDKKLSIETYNVDKQTFSTKQELNSKLEVSTYNADKVNFATKAELQGLIDDERPQDNKTYSSNKIDSIINSIDISSQLSNLATKEEVAKKLNIQVYNNDKNTFATKTELDTKANKEVVENLSNNTLTKQEFNNQKDNFQLKSDNTLQTTNKTIVGAINELKVNNIGSSKNVFIPSDVNLTPTTYYTGNLFTNELTQNTTIAEDSRSHQAYEGLFAVKSGSVVKMRKVNVTGSSFTFDDSKPNGDPKTYILEKVKTVKNYDLYNVIYKGTHTVNVPIFLSLYFEITTPSQYKELLIISLYNFMEFKA